MAALHSWFCALLLCPQADDIPVTTPIPPQRSHTVPLISDSHDYTAACLGRGPKNQQALGGTQETRRHLEEAPGHGSAAPVHEAVETEVVVGVRALPHHVERPLRRAVQAHVAAGIVQGQLELAKVGAVCRHIAERQDGCNRG